LSIAATAELRDRIRRLEDEIEEDLKRRRAELHADFEGRKVRFEAAVLEQQRRFRTGLLQYVLGAQWRNAVSAPFVYAVILPLMLLDLFVCVYQHVCFRLYGIPRVRRRDYLVFDRAHLGYLNLLEKINCAYCSYANGLVSFVKEVVGRTEQYWCPIKHARARAAGASLLQRVRRLRGCAGLPRPAARAACGARSAGGSPQSLNRACLSARARARCGAPAP